MFEDSVSDPFTNSATLVITQSIFDKRALCTTDPTSLAISLTNMHYLSIHFPSRLTVLLQSNGCLELLVTKIRYLASLKNHKVAEIRQKAEIGFSVGIACLSSAAACGSAHLRYRIVYAKLIPILLPILETACNILETVRQQMAVDVTTCTLYHIPKICHSSSSPNRESEHREEPAQMLASEENIDSLLLTPHDELPVGDLGDGQDASFCSLSGNNDMNTCQVRVQDLLNIAKLVAYISKYEAPRVFLRTRYPLFSFLELLTDPTVIPEVRKWAGSSMRNAVRNSNSSISKRCGLITCENMAMATCMTTCDSCQVPYCSLDCKESALKLHRNWCTGSGIGISSSSLCHSSIKINTPGF